MPSETVPNLPHAEIMKRLDRLNACHRADTWLTKHQYNLRGVLDNIPLSEWTHWLYLKCMTEDALERGIPQVWIDIAFYAKDQFDAEVKVLKQSYLENNKQKNWDGYNQAFEDCKLKWRTAFRQWLLSTIVDEEDTR